MLPTESQPDSWRRRRFTSVALVDDGIGANDEILAALAKIPEPLFEVIELTGGNSGKRPKIVIVTLGEEDEAWASKVQEIRQHAPSAALIAAISSRSTGKVRQALRAGADDVIFLPVEPSDLSRCLVRANELLPGRDSHHATICSVVSVAGGVGVSSLALALGFALGRQDGKRVALIDLGMQCGTLAAMLGLTPESTIGELIDPAIKIDSLRLESSLVTHRSGLYLLAAPKRIEESELVSVSTVAAVLEVMRELFDFIVIDCGHHMNEALIAAWEQSTHLFYVVEQSVGSVRPAQRFLEMFERLNLTEPDLQFVLNRYDPTSPFEEAKIASVLRRPIGARVARDEAAFQQFQLECADLARLAPKSPSRIAIDALAANLSGLQTAPPEAHPFLARVRAVLKQPGANIPNPLQGRSFGRTANTLPAHGFARVKPSVADI